MHGDDGSPVELSEVETIERVPVLRVSGDVDLSTCDELRTRLTEVVERGTRLIVVDISQVDFFDSSGLKVLDEVQRAVRAAGRDIALVCPQERLLRLFRITGLDERFAIGSTTEGAVTATPGRRAEGD